MQDRGPSLRAEDRRPAASEPPPPRPSRSGWGSGFLMGVLTLAFLLVGGWVALEWFIFPALDGTAGRALPAPIRQNTVIPDSSISTGSALTPVKVPTVVELPSMAPPANPAPAVMSAAANATTPTAAADGEMAVVQGTGISLRSGPNNTEPVIATRPRGTSLRVFARQNGWVQVGDNQPIGWGWAPLLSSAPPSTADTPPH